MPSKTPLVRADRSPAFDGLEQLEQRLALSTVYWDGGGDGVTLTDKKNWECNTLPGASDVAVIDVAANPAIEMNGGCFTVKQLVLNEKLTMTGGTINALCLTTIKGEGTLNLGGGLYTGGRIDDYGRFNWTGGKLAGCGDVQIKSGGAMCIDGEGDRYLARDITNHGTLMWAGANIDGRDSGGTVIRNAADGVMKAAGTNTEFRSNCWPGGFDNQGLFIRDGEGYARLAVPVVSSGDIVVAGGRAEFVAGGDNTGTRAVGAGAVLYYFGNFSHGAGSTLTGGGTTIWQGGTHTITGQWNMDSTLYVSNSTVTGDATLDVGGVLNWGRGAMTGSGGVNVLEDGKIAIRGMVEHHLARNIESRGALVWNEGALMFEGSTLTNAGVFYLGPNAAATGAGAIVNTGEMHKVAPTASTFDGVTIDNTGLLAVHNGTMSVDPAKIAQLTEGVLTGGAWTVYEHATLDLRGAAITTIAGGTSVTRVGGAGFAALTSLERLDGSLTISGGVPLELVPASGTFTNNGALVLRRGTTLRVSGDYVQTDVGLIDIGIASPGMLVTGRLVTAEHVSLDGIVRFTLELGFTPSAGNTFAFVDAASLTGEFGTMEFPVVAGVAPGLVYGTTGVRLSFVAV
ncbi:MAG: hypothetical protein IT437_03720 [Phycisphaerales bacterium]|nr:hypothetical protein [Phycisphaerales bacterium]